VGEKERENLSRINYFFKAFGVKITQNSRNSCQDYLRQFAEHATRATDKSFNNINSHNCTETKIYNGFTLRRREEKKFSILLLLFEVKQNDKKQNRK